MTHEPHDRSPELRPGSLHPVSIPPADGTEATHHRSNAWAAFALVAGAAMLGTLLVRHHGDVSQSQQPGAGVTAIGERQPAAKPPVTPSSARAGSSAQSPEPAAISEQFVTIDEVLILGRLHDEADEPE